MGPNVLSKSQKGLSLCSCKRNPLEEVAACVGPCSLSGAVQRRSKRVARWYACPLKVLTLRRFLTCVESSVASNRMLVLVAADNFNCGSPEACFSSLGCSGGFWDFFN